MTDEELKALRKPQAAPDWRNDPVTSNQLLFIKSLIEDREVPPDLLDTVEDLIGIDKFTKGRAGDIIAKLKHLPLRDKQDRSKGKPDPEDVPTGRYALQTGPDPNDITFYRVFYKEYPGNRVLAVWVQAGPKEYKQTYYEAKRIIKTIYRSGATEAAMLYGKRIGRCGFCGLPLTRRISRETGCGPVCGERYVSGWQTLCQTMMSSIQERGLDPNEVVQEIVQ